MPIAKQNKVLLKVERKHRCIAREKQWAPARWLISQKAPSFFRGYDLYTKSMGENLGHIFRIA
jgi:hypothetical protein